jgi:hypothetical protein
MICVNPPMVDRRIPLTGVDGRARREPLPHPAIGVKRQPVSNCRLSIYGSQPVVRFPLTSENARVFKGLRPMSNSSPNACNPLKRVA